MIRSTLTVPIVLVMAGAPAAAQYHPGYAPYYPPVYNYYNTYPVRERVIQENLVPAYVFQVLNPVAAPRPAPPPVMPAPMPARLAMPAGTAELERVVEMVVRRLQVTPGEDVPPMLDEAALGPSPAAAPAPPFSQAQLTTLANSCHRCHNARGLSARIKPKGGVILFDEQDQWAPRRVDGSPLDPAEIHEVVRWDPGHTPTMPQGVQADPGKRLPQDVVDALRAWAGGR